MILILKANNYCTVNMKVSYNLAAEDGTVVAITNRHWNKRCSGPYPKNVASQFAVYVLLYRNMLLC